MLSGLESSYSQLAVLGVGLAFGLKHATEVDHIVAVSTIVSEHRSLWRSVIVGALWGMGHTVSLIAVGVVVLVLRVAIPAWVASWLELGVALMIIGLGGSALVRTLRRRREFHLHRHQHDGVSHVHVHFHNRETEHAGPVGAHSHAVSIVGIKPFLVGAMHGLAGSAALMLLVLAQTESLIVGLVYLGIFGLGSIFGMVLMSGLVGLPFLFTSRRLSSIHFSLQTFAGALSVVFGLWYAYATGLISQLWKTLS
jgi:ABC-type nickel/cobalt efflux system permease component RcnA